MLTKLLLLPVFFVFSVFAVDTIPMKDFKALESTGRHREILSKANRVPPPERNADWSAMVTKSVKAVVKDLETEADRQWAFEIGNLLTKEHPHLQKDKDLMGTLGDLAVLTYSTKGIATPFYAQSLSKADPRCKDEKVRDAVTDAFVKPGFDREKAAAKTIAFEFCADSLDEEWAKSFVDSDHGFESACSGLLKLKKLSGVKKGKCEKITGGKK